MRLAARDGGAEGFGRVVAALFHLLLAAAASAVVWVTLFGGLSFAGVSAVAGQSMVVLDTAAAGMAVAVWRRRALDGAMRRAWCWLSAAAGLRLLGDVLFAVFASWHAFPAPGDVARLAMVPVMLVGLLMVPGRRSGPGDRARLALDISAVFLSGAMVVWYAIVGPALTEYNLANAHQITAAICYPVGDLMLLFGLAVVVLRSRLRRIVAMAWLAIAALVAEAAGDAYLTYISAHHGTEQWLPWQFACWVTGHVLFLASNYHVWSAPSPALSPAWRAEPRRPPAVATSGLPYLGVAMVVVVLVTAAVRQGEIYPWVGLIVGAVLTTVTVTLRQAHLLRENHRLAFTDNLTGLANRAQLHSQLDACLAQSLRTGRASAVLLADMNGFKQINDALGHAAGDQLLIAFAGMLRRAVLGGDLIARLGGDEFVVVLRNIGHADNAQAAVRRIREEMSAPVLLGDTVVRAEAAIGVAMAEPGDDVDTLLRRADEAMYRAKAVSRA
jgi:diguanylate cyclase